MAPEDFGDVVRVVVGSRCDPAADRGVGDVDAALLDLVVEHPMRMFVGAELRNWLLEAGFTAVELLDANGDTLTAQSRRMISIAHR